MKYVLIVLLVHFVCSANAQIGMGTNIPDSSAALHIHDTARGLLIPKMKYLQKSAIHNPAEGLMIYQTDSIQGFWYFTHGQWRNMTPTNNGGKQTIILSGNISNSEAQAKIEAEHGPNTQEIRIIGCINLTEVDLSMITDATEINIYNNAVLQKVDLSNLVTVTGSFSIRFCPKLINLNLTSLKTMSQGIATTPGFLISNCGIKNLSFPALKEIFGGATIEFNDSLATIVFPTLERHLGKDYHFDFNRNYHLTSISFASLKETAVLTIDSDSTATSIQLPQLIKAQTISFYGLFSAISLPSLTTISNSLGISGEVPSVSLPVLLSVPTISITNSKITNLSAPSLTTSTTIEIKVNSRLSNISFPAMTAIGSLTISDNYAISSVSLPSLVTINNLEISSSAITSFVLPQLSNAQNFTLSKNNYLISVSLPSLITTGKLKILSTTLGSFSSPALTTAGSLFIGSDNMYSPNTALTAIAFPSLTSLTDGSTNSQITTCINLTSINISNLTSFSNNGFALNGNKFPSSTINALLNKFVSITPQLTNRNFYLNQYVPAPPTGQGLIDKATLVARPNSVNTD